MRTQLIGKIAEAAQGLPPERRNSFVRGACREDEELCQEVSRLMAKAS